ncbi:MAG: hypothetical protein WC307_04050 [Candidatus Nanoarchaeia archaeon]
MAGNDNANFFELMKLTGLLFKLKPEQLFSTVTRNPALTLKRLNQGLIKEGFKADLQIIDIDSNLFPLRNKLSNLIYSRTKGPSSLILDGVMVIKNNKVLYTNEKILCKKFDNVFNKLKL